MERSIVGVTAAMVHYFRRPPHSISPRKEARRAGTDLCAFAAADEIAFRAHSTFLSSGKVRGSRFLEWVGGPREARSWPSKSWRRELSMDPTLVKAAAAGGGG